MFQLLVLLFIIKLYARSNISNIFNASCFSYSESIVYKKTDEWYIEWQQVTTNDNEWYSEWQRLITSESKWQWVTASDISGTTNENGTVHFKEWLIAVLSMIKTDNYYFKGWLTAVRVVNTSINSSIKNLFKAWFSTCNKKLLSAILCDYLN